MQEQFTILLTKVRRCQKPQEALFRCKRKRISLDVWGGAVYHQTDTVRSFYRRPQVGSSRAVKEPQPRTAKDSVLQTRILLVDDHRVLCQGMRVLLGREAGFTVVA